LSPRYLKHPFCSATEAERFPRKQASPRIATITAPLFTSKPGCRRPCAAAPCPSRLAQQSLVSIVKPAQKDAEKSDRLNHGLLQSAVGAWFPYLQTSSRKIGLGPMGGDIVVAEGSSCSWSNVVCKNADGPSIGNPQLGATVGESQQVPCGPRASGCRKAG